MTPETIKKAIATAVAQHGQGQALEDKILAWFEQLVYANTSMKDKDAVQTFVEQLYDATTLSDSTETTEGD